MDYFDDALSGTNPSSFHQKDPKGRMANSSSSRTASMNEVGRQQREQQAEAGKVWDRGRNWTTVVVEVVPGGYSFDPFNTRNTKKGEAQDGDEDEDVLEIPLFVRVEYETDVVGDAGGTRSGAGPENEKEKGERKEKRELAYWCVVGVGRIERGKPDLSLERR